MLSAGVRFDCLYCLREDATVMRLDRKGRPYTRCGMCGTKTFISDPAALRGLMLLAPAVRAFVGTLQAGALADAQAQGVGLVETLGQSQARQGQEATQ